MKVRLVLAILAGWAAVSAAYAAEAPRLGIDSFAALATPLPYPYDKTADAKRMVARAKARARAQGKLLLIDLGGNWCPDCRILAGTIALPELRAFLEARFVIVPVDVGRFDRNLEIPAHYGLRDRLAGVPSVLIVDPRSDRLLNAGHTAALSDARSMSPQALADWLARWAP
jgi:thiol-disulfide isomerase/thioredoxin